MGLINVKNDFRLLNRKIKLFLETQNFWSIVWAQSFYDFWNQNFILKPLFPISI